jgi:AraC family transcriptional regulator
VKLDLKNDSVLTIENSISYMGVSTLVSTSRGRGWRGVTYDLYGLTTDIDVHTPPVDHHALAYCLEGSGSLWQRRNGRTHESTIRAGSLIIMASGDSRSWRGTAPPSLRIRIPTSMLAEAATETTNTSRMPEMIDVFHTRDLFIGKLAPILISELERPAHPAQSLIIESISYVLAGHLLRHYDAFHRTETKITGLAPKTLASVVAYIEDHGDGDMSLDSLAQLANLSRFHFTRMFKLSTGVSPMTYVELSRIRKAQALIKQANLSLAAIALEVGFADQSHFARRFRFHIGCTPSDYASMLGVRRFRPSTPADTAPFFPQTFNTSAEQSGAGRRKIRPTSQESSIHERNISLSFATRHEYLLDVREHA